MALRVKMWAVLIIFITLSSFISAPRERETSGAWGDGSGGLVPRRQFLVKKAAKTRCS
jgi:hypothetical protein